MPLLPAETTPGAASSSRVGGQPRPALPRQRHPSRGLYSRRDGSETPATAPPVQALVPAAQQPVTPLPVQALEPVVAAPQEERTVRAAPLQHPTPVVVEADGGAPLQRSPTVARVPGDSIAPPRLLSPTPATPPPSPRAEVRRRLLALGVPLTSHPSSSRATRAETWSPAALGLANGASNGVVPGTLLHGGSLDEEERGGSPSRRR